MTKFYIATSLQRVPAHNLIRDALVAKGWEITYDWTVHGSVKKISHECLRDVGIKMSKGVCDADVVVVLLPGGKGTHTELGMALGADKRVIIHTEDARFFSLCDDTVAFYHLPKVSQLVCSLEAAAEAIENEVVLCHQ